VLLARQTGKEGIAEKAYRQLLQDFPENIWTRRTSKASGVTP
jgi:hypothetical protein